MKNNLVIIILFIVINASTITAQDKTYFAFGNSNGLYPFYGYYQNKVFQNYEPKHISPFNKDSLDIELTYLLKNYHGKGKLNAISITGENLESKILEVEESIDLYYEPYEPWIILKNSYTLSKNNNQLYLFWNSDLNITAISTVPVTLSEFQIDLFDKHIKKLWNNAKQTNENIDPKIIVSKPNSYIVDNSRSNNLIIVEYSFDIQYTDDYIDDRGFIFILYSIEDKRIILSKFGHPEWELNRKNVKIIKPLLFFQIDGDTNIYFVSDYCGPWESLEYAIFNLVEGQYIMRAF